MDRCKASDGCIFAVKFVSILLATLFLIDQEFIKERFLVPYSHFVASVSSLFLAHLGIDTLLNGSFISHHGRGVNIETGCSAVSVMALFFSAVVSYPKPFLSKVKGLTAGLGFIFVINILRIAGLFIFIVFSIGNFDVLHIWIGQAFVIGSTFLIWSLYLNGLPEKLTVKTLLENDSFKKGAIFFIAMLAGLFVHGRLMQSSIASQTATAMVHHSKLILNLFGIETGSRGAFIGNGMLNLKVINSCLAPPISVLLYAFILATSIRFKTKIILIVASLPLFYILGVAKITSLFLFSSPQDFREGFVYNHYYPSIIIAVIIAGIVLSRFRREKETAIHYIFTIAVTAFVTFSVWGIIGEHYMNYLILLPLYLLFGIKEIAFDPYQIFSAMPAYQIPLSISLLLYYPFSGMKENIARLSFVLVMLTLLEVIVISFFNLYPIPLRAGYLRLIALAPPLLYWIYLLNKGKSPQSIQAESLI